MHDCYQLLDIKEALTAAEEALGDAVYYVRTMRTDSGDAYPPEGATFVANATALLASLADLLPAAFAQAQAEEQAALDEESERWEPSSY